MSELPRCEFLAATAASMSAACSGVVIRGRVGLLLLAAALPLGAQGTRQPENRAYNEVVDGMSCRQQSNGRLDCSYAVGSGLRFRIEGVGQDEALINFVRVDSTGGWVAGYSLMLGCVVVRPVGATADSAAALAFVAPRDGRVYRVWQHCKNPPRR